MAGAPRLALHDPPARARERLNQAKKKKLLVLHVCIAMGDG